MTNIKVTYASILPVLILLLNGVIPNEASKSWGRNGELVKHDGTVKSIKIEDGYKIDCVDIYKQPAFSHPLLKNHTIKDGIPKRNKKTNAEYNGEIFQEWQKKGRCPEKTIPIRRRTRNSLNITKSLPFPNHHVNVQPVPGCTSKVVAAYTLPASYHGAQTLLNVWKPLTELMDFSLQEMVLLRNIEGDPIEMIEVGFHVYPNLYFDAKTHLFVSWTRDGYATTGCYNLFCAGFVQTDSTYELGGSVLLPSAYNGQQIAAPVQIQLDPDTGDWNLYVRGILLGYWPQDILTNLSFDANYVGWAGQVEDCNPSGTTTTTQMGSGDFAQAGFGRAAFFGQPQILLSDTYIYVTPSTLDTYSTHPGCYNIATGPDSTIWYGGPGRSPTCP